MPVRFVYVGRRYVLTMTGTEPSPPPTPVVLNISMHHTSPQSSHCQPSALHFLNWNEIQNKTQKNNVEPDLDHHCFCVQSFLSQILILQVGG